jgi:hypothetical protein
MRAAIPTVLLYCNEISPLKLLTTTMYNSKSEIRNIGLLIQKKKQRRKVCNIPRHILAAILKSSISGVLDLDDRDAPIAAAIPQQTLRDYTKRAQAQVVQERQEGGGVIDFEALVEKKHPKSLTTLEEQDFLSEAANARDLSNSGMSRKVMINSISFITQCGNLNYLIREIKLPDCKNGGRVLTAQKLQQSGRK